jgi:glycerophosphoryl diester phosphodiesterase
MPEGVKIALICTAALLALLVLAYLYLIKPGKRRDLSAFGNQFAHRGLWDEKSPENSLSAIKKAVDAGYGIEFDIHLTRDGRVVVFHDDTLERMCGVQGRIEDMTYEQLSAFRLLQSDERIPLLTELLEVVDGQVPLLVELKGEAADASLCPVADAILSAYKGPYMIESFNPLLVQWYRKNRPDVVRGQLFCNLNKGKKIKKLIFFLITALLTNAMARPHFLAYGLDSTRNPSFLICRHLFRAPNYVWTVREPGQIPRSKHCNGIIFERFIPKE